MEECTDCKGRVKARRRGRGGLSGREAGEDWRGSGAKEDGWGDAGSPHTPGEVKAVEEGGEAGEMEGDGEGAGREGALLLCGGGGLICLCAETYQRPAPLIILNCRALYYYFLKVSKYASKRRSL